MTAQRRNESNFVLQGMILASASILVRIIGLVYRIPLTNILGNDGNAFYSNAFEVYNIALLLSSYSIPLAVSKIVSVRMKKNEPGNAYKVLKTAIIFAAAIGLVVSLFVFFGAEFLATNIMKMPMSMYALKVLAPCLFVVAILGVIRGYFQGLGTTVPTAISQVLEQILNAVVSVVAASHLYKIGLELITVQGGDELLPSAYGASGGTMGTVAGATMALFFVIIVLVKHCQKNMKTFNSNHTYKEESVKEILPVLIATIIPVVMSSAISNINTILDQGIYNNIMASQGYTQGEYANLWGIFSGKYKVLMNVPLGVSSALAAAFIPSITAAVYTRNKRDINNKITIAMKCSMLIAIPSFVAYLIFGGEVLYLLFSDDTVEARRIMRIGCIGLTSICLSTITSAVLQGFNKMMIPVKNALKALIVHMTSLLFMLAIFRWNIYAVVIADVIFATTLCALNVREMKKIAKYKLRWGQVFILPFIASFGMGGVSSIFFVLAKLVMERKIAFLATILVAISVYIVLLFRLKIISEHDLELIPGGSRLKKFLKRIKLI